jgi:hypothetical protein
LPRKASTRAVGVGIAEIYVVLLARESIEPQRVLRGTETRLAAVSIHFLERDNIRFAELPGAVGSNPMIVDDMENVGTAAAHL